jgi:hypothetical protein
MTAELGRPPAPRAVARLARIQLTAIAARLSEDGIASGLTWLGDIPVLTIDDRGGGPNGVTIAVDPDLGGEPGLRFDCTCLWMTDPGATPQATADIIAAVLNAVRAGSAPA